LCFYVLFYFPCFLHDKQIKFPVLFIRNCKCFFFFYLFIIVTYCWEIFCMEIFSYDIFKIIFSHLQYFAFWIWNYDLISWRNEKFSVLRKFHAKSLDINFLEQIFHVPANERIDHIVYVIIRKRASSIPRWCKYAKLWSNKVKSQKSVTTFLLIFNVFALVPDFRSASSCPL